MSTESVHMCIQQGLSGGIMNLRHQVSKALLNQSLPNISLGQSRGDYLKLAEMHVSLS